MGEDMKQVDDLTAAKKKSKKGCHPHLSEEPKVLLRLDGLIEQQKELDKVTAAGLPKNGGPGLFPPAEEPWQQRLLDFNSGPESELAVAAAGNDEVFMPAKFCLI